MAKQTSGRSGTAQGAKARLAREVAIIKTKNPDLTMKEIGLVVNRHRETVSRLLKTDEAQEILARCHSRIIEKSTKAVDNIVNAVDNFDAAYKEGNKVKAGISWEATKLVTQIPGLTPSSSPSIIHQTFINNQTNMIDPTISDLIKKHLGGFDEPIDVTPIIQE